MKDYIQELGNLGSADVAVITPQVLADSIEEIRRNRRVFAQFYRVNRDLVNGGGKEVDFPKKGSGIAVTFDVAEGTGISASSMSYDAVTIAVKKAGIGLGFTGEAIRNANRDVIADAIQQAGEVWADTVDLVAMEAMLPTVTTLATGAATVDASLFVGLKSAVAAPTNCSIKVTATTGSSIIFTGGNTITYWYLPTTRAEGDTIGALRVAGQNGSLVAKDLLNIRHDIIGKTFDPQVIMLHPDRLTDVLYDSTVKFLEKSAYEGVGPIYTGEIGQIWGMRVIVSTRVPKYGAFVIDPSGLGREVIRKPLKLVRDDYTGMSADVLRFWGFGEFNFGVINAQAYGGVAMTGTYSPTVN